MISSRLSRRAAAITGAALLSGAAAPAITKHRMVPVSELVIDADSGATLSATAPDRVRPPASLAKMMTRLLAFEAIEAGRLREPLVITARGARQPPSRLGLAKGRRIRIQVAVRAIAVISANDVAVAVAERLAGSEKSFVAAMNHRAAEPGMTRTRFGNATGLEPSGGTSTAHDIALLARRLTTMPDAYRVFSRRSIRWQDQVRPNHNRLLGSVQGVDGIKTGYTIPAGFNLAASARRSGRRVIVVVLGARTAAARDLLVTNLLNAGFSPAAPSRVCRSSEVVGAGVYHRSDRGSVSGCLPAA